MQIYLSSRTLEQLLSLIYQHQCKCNWIIFLVKTVDTICEHNHFLDSHIKHLSGRLMYKVMTLNAFLPVHNSYYIRFLASVLLSQQELNYLLPPSCCGRHGITRLLCHGAMLNAAAVPKNFFFYHSFRLVQEKVLCHLKFFACWPL